MRYFRVIDEMSIRMRGRWHIGEVHLPDGTEPILNGGVRMVDHRPLHARITHIGRVLECCRTSFGVTLATKALCDVITSIAGEDIQCIPIMIGQQSGMRVVNALRLIRCIHEQRSVFQKFTTNDPVRPDLAGQYCQVTKLVLDRNAIPSDAHIFRIKDWEVALIVSETVKNAMERIGCYGAEFTELEMA